ncbi:hypothetical protein B0H17DRAFT_1199032 [Mycena rosella]|uniref:Uncharacterized protein n=1 Tax=Mycena rosella TaxID=1033263 RepID=A0AAD7GKB8_MYCRO|nr:hypothetical protein B0H17DRAFT_1199032 [Mycena rosella]
MPPHSAASSLKSPDELFTTFMLEDMVPPFACSECRLALVPCTFVTWGLPCKRCEKRLCLTCTYSYFFEWELFRRSPQFDQFRAPFGRRVLSYAPLYKHAIFARYRAIYPVMLTALYAIELRGMSDPDELRALRLEWILEGYGALAQEMINQRLDNVLFPISRLTS